MSDISCCGEIIAGEFGKIVIRQKSDGALEIGNILVEERGDCKVFLQVFDLMYGSQLSRSALENISGMRLEGLGVDLEFLEPHLRNYVIALAKPILFISDKPRNPKILPNFSGALRHIKKDDLEFLTKPSNPLYLGKVRSGSNVIDADIYLEGIDVLSHHVLIPATTGRGKSNLVKVMLWDALDRDFCGCLVLDAHNEYYGKNSVNGLRDHPKAGDYLRYYSPNPNIRGAYGLVINLKSINPGDFRGIADFTETQLEAMDVAYNTYHGEWISNIILGSEIRDVKQNTVNVLRRKFDRIMGIYIDPDDENIKCRSRSFSNTIGESTICDIIQALEKSNKVIVDTSMLGDQAELLIGSIITNRLLDRHKKAKEDDTLQGLPVVSIVIEEAPRVLGDEVLRFAGSNIYSDIAREGRKFKIGLVAITQLTSVIRKTILANMNTKIILGNELAAERNAIIESASQDLSNDDRTISSMDKGEAIISSNFTKFAIPVKIPLFEDLVKDATRPTNKKIGVIT